MASYTDFYCNAATGSNLNSGSTESASATHTYASGSWVSGTGVFTVASGNPSSDGVAVGDFASVYANGATVTGFVGRVTARDATTITVSLTAKSGTAPTNGTGDRTLKIGGCWKGPNGTEAFPVNFASGLMVNATGHDLYVNFKNNATYSITAAMSETILDGPIWFGGYTTTVRDGGKAIIDGGTSGASYVLLTISNTFTTPRMYQSLIFQNNGATGNAILVNATTTLHTFISCEFRDCRGSGLSNGLAIYCLATACNKIAGANNGGGFSSCVAWFCEAFDSIGGTGYAGFYGTAAYFCRSYRNTNYGFFNNGSSSSHWIGCDAYHNTSAGFIMDGANPTLVHIVNCNALRNGNYGISMGSSTLGRVGIIRNCGFGAGTMANTAGTINLGTSIGLQETGTITYPTNTTPWRDPDNGDFVITHSEAKGTGFAGFDIGSLPHVGYLNNYLVLKTG